MEPIHQMHDIGLGVTLLALVSHLFFWRGLRDPVYREAAGLVASVLMNMLVWPGTAPLSWLVASLLFGPASLVLWFGLRLTRQFLDLASHWPRVLPLYRGLERGGVLLFLSNLIVPHPPWLGPVIALGGLIVATVLTLTIVKVWRRYPPTPLFALASLLGVTGSVPIGLSSWGVPGLPLGLLTLATPLGLCLAMVCLHLALAERVWFAHRAREVARQRLDDLRRIYLDRLEAQVADRTQQLAHLAQQRDRILSLTAHDLRDHLASLSFLAAAPNIPPVIVNLHQQGVQLLEVLESHRRRPSGLSAGSNIGHGTDLNLHRIVERRYARFRDQARQSGIQLVNRIPGSGTCRADVELLDALLDCLIDHAVKGGSAGGCIEIRERPDGQPGFEVAGSDPGVARTVVPDQLRLDGTQYVLSSCDRSGRDSALTLCRVMLQTLGGELEQSPSVLSASPASLARSGRGVVFSVRLPDPGTMAQVAADA